jgi:hypothetical protein
VESCEVYEPSSNIEFDYLYGCVYPECSLGHHQAMVPQRSMMGMNRYEDVCYINVRYETECDQERKYRTKFQVHDKLCCFARDSVKYYRIGMKI